MSNKHKKRKKLFALKKLSEVKDKPLEEASVADSAVVTEPTFTSVAEVTTESLQEEKKDLPKRKTKKVTKK